MNAIEMAREPVLLSPAEQLTQTFGAVAEATHTAWLLRQQPSLRALFNSAVAEHPEVPRGKEYLLETDVLVRTALNGYQVLWNERDIQLAEDAKRDSMRSLQSLLLELHETVVAVSSINGQNDIEYDLINPETSQFATENHVARALGRIVGYRVDYTGSLLYLERKASLRKRQKRAQFIATIFNPQTGEPLVKIEDAD